jgi:hypothetical protein
MNNLGIDEYEPCDDDRERDALAYWVDNERASWRDIGIDISVFDAIWFYFSISRLEE